MYVRIYMLIEMFGTL